MENDVFIYQTDAGYDNLENKMGDFATWFEKLLASTIKPGNRVVIKPNLVKECQIGKPELWEHIITNPEIIRFVLKCAITALQNDGEILVVETPEGYSDFQEILKRTGLEKIIKEIQANTSVKITCLDLREERWISDSGTILKRIPLSGDPKGYVSINLKENSEFFGKKNKNYYGADYDIEETSYYHNDIDNIYVLSKTVLDCDVYINLPKLKTHKLAGLTASLKNLVGVCVRKNSIPHHTIGTPENGGDKFPDGGTKRTMELKLTNLAVNILDKNIPILNHGFVYAKKMAFKIFGSSSTTIRNGAWYGNDTIWRSILDLNKILIYSDKDGVIHDKPQRKYITLIDGIVGGEGNGPMEADPKNSGIIIAGSNALLTDTVAATIMGFDYQKIPSIYKGYDINNYPLSKWMPQEIHMISNNDVWNKSITDIITSDTLKFRPHFGWVNHIERR